MSVEITLTNTGKYTVNVTFDGPSYKQVEVDPEEDAKLSVQAGKYKVTFARPSRRDSATQEFTWGHMDKVSIDANDYFGAVNSIRSFARATDVTYGERTLQLINNTADVVAYHVSEEFPIIKIRPSSTLELSLKYGRVHTLVLKSGGKEERIHIKDRAGDVILHLSSVFPVPVPDSVSFGSEIPIAPIVPNGIPDGRRGKGEIPNRKIVREEMKVENAMIMLDSYV